MRNKEIILRNFDEYNVFASFSALTNCFSTLSVKPNQNRISGKFKIIGEMYFAVFLLDNQLVLSINNNIIPFNKIEKIQLVHVSNKTIKGEFYVNNSEKIVLNETIIFESFLCDPTPFVESEDESILAFVKNVFCDFEKQQILTDVWS